MIPGGACSASGSSSSHDWSPVALKWLKSSSSKMSIDTSVEIHNDKLEWPALQAYWN